VQAQLIARLTDAEAEELLHCWPELARPAQLPPPGDWRTWLFLAGRGAGKTRAGAEWVRAQVAAGCGRIALIAPTAADARDVMVEGDSGVLSVCWEKDKAGRPLYEPSKRRLTWANGAIATLFSAEEPERLRGPQHDALWADEAAAWTQAQGAWDMAMFGLRLGQDPRAMVTTTPKPIPLLRALLKDAGTVVTRGSTFDNAAHLAPAFLAKVRQDYEGTRLGRQELFAELLDDVQGALWTLETIGRPGNAPDLQRVVVGVDPSGGGDEIGIVAAGKGVDGRFYVLEDATCALSPAGWGRRVAETYHRHRADRIVAERNFGGDMVLSTIRTAEPNARVDMVTASRGKVVRAEPIAALYEQGRVTHLPGLEALETQMLHMSSHGYVGDGSPDRVDALVWALSALALGQQASATTSTVVGLS
jgi:phage terminase large subunit-like protein